jgi:hypothetical protein
VVCSIDSVRNPSSLDRLPANERNAWQLLWRDVDELAERLAKQDKPTKGRKEQEDPNTKPEGRSLPPVGVRER